MNDQGYVPLRERALRAWGEERQNRIAQLTKRANLTLELHKKIETVLGSGLPIKIITDLQDRPIATIEEIRFTLDDRCAKSRKRLMLLDVCSRCAAETGLIIDSLADLGQLFEGLGMKISLGCTECIGITDEELKPPTVTKSTRVRTKRKTQT
jgi:hypothetical protein